MTMRSCTDGTKKKRRTKIQLRMWHISNWIRDELAKHRAERINPFALKMSDDSWKVIRRALLKASKA